MYAKMSNKCGLVVLFTIFILGSKADPHGSNLALNKPVEASSVLQYKNRRNDPAVVVDGSDESDMSSCISTALGDLNPWIQVDLLSHYKINSISLRNRKVACKGCVSRFHHVYIEVHWDKPSPNDTGKGDECFFYQRTMPTSTEEHMKCYQPVSGRYVRVYKKPADRFDTVILCELRVFGEHTSTKPKHVEAPNANRALHRLVEASSLYEIPGGPKSYLDTVVDGSESSGLTTCVSTTNRDSYRWIQVDLVDQYRIHSVGFRNSVKPCPRCGNNFKDVHIEVYKTKPSKYVNGNGKECYFFDRTLPFGQEETVRCKTTVVGRFVRLYTGRKPYQTQFLCELKVFGERADRKHKKATVTKQSLIFSVSGSSVCECAVQCGQHPVSTSFRMRGKSCTCTTLLTEGLATGGTMQTLNFHHSTGSMWILN